MKLDREHKARDKSSLISPKTLEVAAHESKPRENVYIPCTVTLHLRVLGPIGPLGVWVQICFTRIN